MLNKTPAEAHKSGQENVRQKNKDFTEIVPIFLSYIFLSALSPSSDASVHRIAIVTTLLATPLRVICTL